MHVVIVGNGIAGVTVARHVRKRDRKARITMISAESEHHWSRPALMYIYMGHMRYQDTKPYEDHFWTKNRIDLVQGWVDAIDPSAKTLSIDGRRTMHYDKLVLATGSIPNKFGWPGQDLERVSGMYSLNDLAALEGWSPDIRHAVIVGGGLIGVELAEMLHSRGKHVTFLVRETDYWSNVLPTEEARIVNEVIKDAGIDLRLETELTEIVDDGTGAAGAVVTSRGDRIEAQYVGLTAGVRPNTAIVAGSGIEAGRGILVDRTLQTNVPDVFACGDCAEIRTPEGERNLIQAVWYTGRFQGETVAANLFGDGVEYDPGIWFNSAKFIDLECQVYGDVPGARAMATDDAPDSLYWEHGSRRKSVRIVHRDGVVVGFNLMGIRFRHRTCEAWIREGRSLDYVIKHLRKAAFDPEFYRWHGKEIAAAKGA
jgi:3-phenylpropionate/trans-cinnamate dioxygenase ferredoxin reductase subunit